MIPTSIDGTDITGATIDGTDVTEITVDGDTVFTAGPELSDIVAPGNLVMWYPFEDGTGEDETRTGGLLDSNGIAVGDSTDYSLSGSGSVTHASNIGVNDLVNGDPSGAFDFTGSNELSFSEYSIPSNDITISAWVKVNSGAGGIFATQASDVFDLSYGGTYQTNPPNEYTIQYFDGSRKQLLSGVSTTGQYVHVLATCDSSNDVELFINGVSKATGTSGGITDFNADINVHDTFRGSLDCEIDDCRFYNKTLSQSEIDDIIDNTKPSSFTPI